MNPHNSRIALDPPREAPPRRWRCQYCDQEGLWDELEALECTYVYLPCAYCGQTPECARDCPGIMALLGSPDVYVATDDVALKTRIEKEKAGRGQA